MENRGHEAPLLPRQETYCPGEKENTNSGNATEAEQRPHLMETPDIGTRFSSDAEQRPRSMETPSVGEHISKATEQRPYQASIDTEQDNPGTVNPNRNSRQNQFAKQEKRAKKPKQILIPQTARINSSVLKSRKEPNDNKQKQEFNLRGETKDKMEAAPGHAPKPAEQPPEATENKSPKKSIPYNIACTLLEQNSFGIMEKQLYLYNEKGYWKLISESEANREIRSIIPDDLRCSISKGILYEVYEWLRIMAPPKPDCQTERRHYLNFTDAAYNWKSDEAIEHRKKLMFTHVLQLSLCNLNLQKGCAYKTFINTTFSNDKRTLREFRKFLGLCLSDIRDLKVCFFLYGPSNSGKTVMLNLLKKIVGEEWCSSLSFTQMSNEFAITQLLGKRLNLSGEVSGASNKRLDILKSLTGNDSITASFKGKDHFQFRNESLLVFACNSFPPVTALEEFDSFLSRVIIFPFSNVVPREQWIENLEDVLMEDAGSIILEAVKGLRELEEDNYCFIESPAMKKCKQSFQGKYNSFALFADQHIIKEPDGKVTSEDIRKYYKAFCDNEGYEALENNVWAQYLKQRFECQPKIFILNGDTQGERKRGYQGITLR